MSGSRWQTSRRLSTGLLLVLLAFRLVLSIEHGHEGADGSEAAAGATARAGVGEAARHAVLRRAPAPHDERTCVICQALALTAAAPLTAAALDAPPAAASGSAPSYQTVFLPSCLAPNRAPRGPPVIPG